MHKRLAKLNKKIEQSIINTSRLLHECRQNDNKHLITRQNVLANLSKEFKATKKIISAKKVDSTMLRAVWVSTYNYEEILAEHAELINDYTLRVKKAEILLRRIEKQVTNRTTAPTSTRSHTATATATGTPILISNPFLANQHGNL